MNIGTPSLIDSRTIALLIPLLLTYQIGGFHVCESNSYGKIETLFNLMQIEAQTLSILKTNWQLNYEHFLVTVEPAVHCLL
ncbi:hypothetical protein F4777DRAFT_564293 [Nemania sp. FL0916]|nr:hypothetical protein F4777DRAFT_564293 [Nemania sp. FL0916]